MWLHVQDDDNIENYIVFAIYQHTCQLPDLVRIFLILRTEKHHSRFPDRDFKYQLKSRFCKNTLQFTTLTPDFQLKFKIPRYFFELSQSEIGIAKPPLLFTCVACRDVYIQSTSVGV